jgi:hypothetical protein
MIDLFKQMDKDWDTMLGAMRATGAIIREGELAIEPEVFGLGGREEMLANKEAEQASKGIDWAEFDKQDQIIFSSNE